MFEIPANYKSYVFCTLQVEATHNWPTCDIPEVEYLRYPHRHIFHIKAAVCVSHGDRDVEFIKLKHDILNFMDEVYVRDDRSASPVYSLGATSCEALASRLATHFNLYSCEVSEDGENGAIIVQHTDSPK